jgi:hypothetical protein
VINAEATNNSKLLQGFKNLVGILFKNLQGQKKTLQDNQKIKCKKL